jgi:hypothetical protein
MPIVLKDDRTALETALDCSPDPPSLRLVRILNTGALKTIWATETLLPELREQPDISVGDEPLELRFSDDGRLLPMKT